MTVSEPDTTPLVVVFVGTDHHPFDRICRWVDDWVATQNDGVRCVMQIGTSSPPARAKWVTSLPHDEVQALIHRATAVACHGGPATIMDCLGAGLRPIVVPRRHDLGEHVDNHQVRFTRKLAGRGLIELAELQESLAEKLDRATRDPQSMRIPAPNGDTEAVARFRTAVSQLETTRRRLWSAAAR